MREGALPEALRPELNVISGSSVSSKMYEDSFIITSSFTPEGMEEITTIPARVLP